MLIGAMNHPGFEITAEIEWMAAMRMDFIDLTMEPPCAASWQLDPQKVRAALERHSLSIVGHTAYYLPIGKPIRRGSGKWQSKSAGGASTFLPPSARPG